MTLTRVKPNGGPEETFSRRTYNMSPVFLHYFELGKGIWELDNSGECGWDEDNTLSIYSTYHLLTHLTCIRDRLDMSLPVVQMLEGAKQREEFIFGFDGARNTWEEDTSFR